VRIDVRGLPPGTNVKIDGFVAELPVVVPRGTDKHQIVLEEPSAKGKRVKRELAVVALKDVNLSLEDFALAKEEPPPEAASHKRSRPKKGGDPDGLATPVF
jgi:hypothetical protein